jgi:integrase
MLQALQGQECYHTLASAKGSASMKFTDRSILNLKAKSERYITWRDGGGGLGVRVSPQNRKTFVYMYRANGKPRMMSLGTYPSLPLAEAHKKHGEAVAMLAKGIDPAKLDVQAKIEARRALTLRALAADYLEKWAKPRKRSWKEDQRMLEKDVLPIWGSMKAEQVTRRDVIALLDELAERAPIAANRTLAVMRKMFNFAVSRDIVKVTPCAQVKAPSPENKRDRTLSDKEIRALWRLLDAASEVTRKRKKNGRFLSSGKAAISSVTEFALKLQLVTAQRKGEIIAMEWKDVEGKWWSIPREKAKNKEPHRVYLTPVELDVLEQAKALAGNSPFVFPAGVGGNGHLGAFAPVQALRRITANGAGLKDCTPHDLRRTAATKMSEAGVSRLILSKVLNHKDRTVTAIYDRHSYDREKQQALEIWARKLNAILDGRKARVIPLTRRG